MDTVSELILDSKSVERFKNFVRFGWYIRLDSIVLRESINQRNISDTKSHLIQYHLQH